MKIVSLLRTEPSWREETRRYGAADGAIASGFYVFLMAAYYAAGRFQAGTHIYPGVVLNLGLLALCAVVVLARGGGLAGLGFRRKNALAATLTGLALGAAAVIINGATALLGGQKPAALSAILLNLPFYLVVIALSEEVIFRGYIQSRLFGLIRNNAAATCVAALLFVGMHIPYHVGASGAALLPYLSANAVWFVTLFAWHLVFTYLYRRFHSILAPTIFHGLMDCSNFLCV